MSLQILYKNQPSQSLEGWSAHALRVCSNTPTQTQRQGVGIGGVRNLVTNVDHIVLPSIQWNG